ncbi:hypothetical protein [Dactylosporangium sp. CA-139066]|uniref:hypothetical protein n=1 Tax=Dactylosporangium sp. CA-139066 TaxID=3239930 RepID=UPI003D8DFB2E
MTTDPSVNMVAFRLRREGGAIVTGHGRTRDDDAVRQAWAMVQREHSASPGEVVELYSEWEPSAADAAFVSKTFPKAKLTYSFSRPADGGWDAAFAGARATIERASAAGEAEERMQQVDEQGELVPVLWSPKTAPEMLQMLPYAEIVPGTLVVTVAVAAPTPRGTIGMNHITRAGLAGTPFEDRLAAAAESLTTGLEISAYNDGELFGVSRPGGFAASAIVLPGFAERMSDVIGSEDLIVAITDADCAFLAAAGSPAAQRLRQMVAEAPRGGQPEPTLLRINGRGVAVA